MEEAQIQKLEELKTRVSYIEKEMAEIKTLSQEIKTLSESIIKLATKMEYVSTDVQAIKDEVGELKDKPAKQWGIATQAAISSIVSGIIALAISLLFK